MLEEKPAHGPDGAENEVFSPAGGESQLSAQVGISQNQLEQCIKFQQSGRHTQKGADVIFSLGIRILTFSAWQKTILHHSLPSQSLVGFFFFFSYIFIKHSIQVWISMRFNLIGLSVGWPPHSSRPMEGLGTQPMEGLDIYLMIMLTTFIVLFSLHTVHRYIGRFLHVFIFVLGILRFQGKVSIAGAIGWVILALSGGIFGWLAMRIIGRGFRIICGDFRKISGCLRKVFEPKNDPTRRRPGGSRTPPNQVPRPEPTAGAGTGSSPTGPPVNMVRRGWSLRDQEFFSSQSSKSSPSRQSSKFLEIFRSQKSILKYESGKISKSCVAQSSESWCDTGATTKVPDMTYGCATGNNHLCSDSIVYGSGCCHSTSPIDSSQGPLFVMHCAPEVSISDCGCGQSTISVESGCAGTSSQGSVPLTVQCVPEVPLSGAIYGAFTKSENIGSFSSASDSDFSDPPSSSDSLPGRGSDFRRTCRINVIEGHSEVVANPNAVAVYSPEPPPYTSDSEEEKNPQQILIDQGFFAASAQLNHPMGFRAFAPLGIEIPGSDSSSERGEHPLTLGWVSENPDGMNIWEAGLPAAFSEISQSAPPNFSGENRDSNSERPPPPPYCAKSSPPSFSGQDGEDFFMPGGTPVPYENMGGDYENWDDWTKLTSNVQKNENDIAVLQTNCSGNFSSLHSDIAKVTGLVASLNLSINQRFEEQGCAMTSLASDIRGFVVGQVEEERHRISTELHQSINNFLSSCQKGEMDIQKIAELQKQLLEISVERNVSEKIVSLEEKVHRFFEPRFEEFLQKQKGLQVQFEELLANNRKVVEVQNFCVKLQRGIADVESSVQNLQRHWQEVLHENKAGLAQFTQQLQVVGRQAEDIKNLSGRLDKFEAILGGQQFPWQKIVDFMGKMEETVQNQVRRAMNLQDQKVMEIMMTKMMDEKMREERNAEHFDQIKTDLAASVQNRFSTVLASFAENLQVEKRKRKELEAKFVEFSNRNQPASQPAQEGVPISAHVPPSVPKSASRLPENVFQVEGVSSQAGGTLDLSVLIGFESLLTGHDSTHDVTHQANAAISQVSVCPVGVGGPGGAAPPLSFVSPVVQQVMRNLVAPKFSGRSQDFPQFWIDWERYLRKISMGKEIENALKLELWESALDETNQKFLRMRQTEVGGALSYQEEVARVQAKYSRDQNVGARKRWEEVFIYNQGKITSREWEDFEVNFRTAWKNVKDTTPEEARRVLLAKLPPFTLKWVAEEEERKVLSAPTVRMNTPKATDVGGVSNSILLLVGKKPIKVSKVHDTEYEIVFEQMSDCEKLKNLNGKNFANTTIQVKVSQVEPSLSVDEIFAIVGQKLTLRDRQDLLQSNYSSLFGKQRNRSVGASSEKSKGEIISSSGAKSDSQHGSPKEFSGQKSPVFSPKGGAGFDQPPSTGPGQRSEQPLLQQPTSPAITVGGSTWPGSPSTPQWGNWRPPTPIANGKGWKGSPSWSNGKGSDSSWSGGRGFPPAKGKGKGKDGQKGKGKGGRGKA